MCCCEVDPPVLKARLVSFNTLKVCSLSSHWFQIATQPASPPTLRESAAPEPILEDPATPESSDYESSDYGEEEEGESGEKGAGALGAMGELRANLPNLPAYLRRC